MCSISAGRGSVDTPAWAGRLARSVAVAELDSEHLPIEAEELVSAVTSLMGRHT